MFKTSLKSEFLRTAIRANGIPITQTGQHTDQLLVPAAACPPIDCKTLPTQLFSSIILLVENILMEVLKRTYCMYKFRLKRTYHSLYD